MEPEIYKKGQIYNITYINKDGEEKEYKFTPEEDITKPKIIMKCKEDNKDFIKLKEIKKLEEGVYKMNDDFKNYVDNWIEENQEDLSEMTELDGSEAELIVMDYIQETDAISYTDAVKQGYLTIAEDKLLKVIENNENGELFESNEKDYETLSDLVNDGYGFDLSDKNIDLLTYFEYDPKSNDSYDKCLKTIAENVNITDFSKDYSWVEADLFSYVKNHLSAFESVLDIPGEDEEAEAGNIVESLEGVFAGYMSDSAYETLYQALNTSINESKKIEEDNTELEGTGEDQTQTQLDVEEAVSEVENSSEEDKLATEVANSSLDVLIADEESAIEGYNGFLTQAKNTLLPPLYEVLEKEINEIIRDEEDHINKLNTIKSAFHIEDMPLDESKKLNEGKIDYLKEIQNIVEQAQYNMGLDEFFKFLTDLKDYVDAKHYDNEPVDESKSIKTESAEDKNLANIKACLNQSGIRNPHTVERMAKDVLAILNTYDEDTKDDEGIFYQPVILNAIQDKVEKITGKRPELTIESKEIKTESAEANIFENINTLQDLQEVIENLYEEEAINDDQYDEISDYISTRIDEVEKYIEERSKVTNTDERDIVGIMEDNTLDAIEKVKEIINNKKEVKEESTDNEKENNNYKELEDKMAKEVHDYLLDQGISILESDPDKLDLIQLQIMDALEDYVSQSMINYEDKNNVELLWDYDLSLTFPYGIKINVWEV